MLSVATLGARDRATEDARRRPRAPGRRRLAVRRARQAARALGGAVSLVKVTIANRQVDALVEDLDCSSPTPITGPWTSWRRGSTTSPRTASTTRPTRMPPQGSHAPPSSNPTWPIAAYNLASANQLGGDLDGAVAALAPWLASAPVQTYAQVTSDPELAPLLARPELRALRAKSPGLESDDRSSATSRTPETGSSAVARVEASWGTCLFEREVDVFEAATGKRMRGRANRDKQQETTPECRSRKEAAEKKSPPRPRWRHVRSRSSKPSTILGLSGQARARHRADWRVRGQAHQLAGPREARRGRQGRQRPVLARTPSWATRPARRPARPRNLRRGRACHGHARAGPDAKLRGRPDPDPRSTSFKMMGLPTPGVTAR